MNLTSHDFQSWKEQAMTKEVMSFIEELILLDTEYLQANAGMDPLADRFRAGHIQGFRDVLDYQFSGDKDE